MSAGAAQDSPQIGEEEWRMKFCSNCEMDDDTVLTFVKEDGPDNIGVKMFDHAIDRLIVNITDKEDSSGEWSFKRENASTNSHFSSLSDIPSNYYDYEHSFIQEAKKREIPNPRLKKTDHMKSLCYKAGELLPKYLSFDDLKQGFWEDITHQHPDGVFRVKFNDGSTYNEFRIFLEVDYENKSNAKKNRLKIGQFMYEACDACFFLNDKIPAFTVRMNFHNYPCFVESDEEFDQSEGKAWHVISKAFQAMIRVLSHIFSKVFAIVETRRRDLNVQLIPTSLHFQIWMKRCEQKTFEVPASIHKPWFEKEVFRQNFLEELLSVNPVVEKVDTEISYIQLYHQLDQNVNRGRIPTSLAIFQMLKAQKQFGKIQFEPCGRELIVKYNDTQKKITESHDSEEIDAARTQKDILEQNFKGSGTADETLDMLKKFDSESDFFPSENTRHKNQYIEYDYLYYRHAEQIVVFLENCLLSLSTTFQWKGDDLTPMKPYFQKLKTITNGDANAFYSRKGSALDKDQYVNNLSYRNETGSLQSRLFNSLHRDLPELETKMQAWIETFNIPNACLFLRIIRCNNLIALRELSRQYFAGDMPRQVNTVLRQMPVCTESEMRWLFRYILKNSSWMHAKTLSKMTTGQQIPMNLNLMQETEHASPCAWVVTESPRSYSSASTPGAPTPGASTPDSNSSFDRDLESILNDFDAMFDSIGRKPV